MRSSFRSVALIPACFSVFVFLFACGGGGEKTSYTIGGVVNGLTGTGLVLQNNEGDDLEITSNGAFTFATSVAEGSGYSVSVLAQPMGQACAVTGGSGTVSGANVTDLALECTPASVSALYTNGADWNDYVKNDSTDKLTATDAACDPAVDSMGYAACMHGGEMRVVEVTGKSSCAGLTATDALGAFDWVCDESTDPVRMVSTGLKDGKNLSDLLEFATPGWNPDSVEVLDGGMPYLATTPAAWWPNPVVEDNDGGYLDGEGTIYVVTESGDIPEGYIINASSVGLVGQPGVIINGPGAGAGSHVVLADGSINARDFLWLEGKVDAAGDYLGVYVRSRFSVLRNVTVENANDRGVVLSSSLNSTLSGVTAANIKGLYGVVLSSTYYSTLSGVTAANNANHGVYFYTSSYNRLSGVTAVNNGSDGVTFSLSSDNILSGVTASNNNNYGVYFYTSSYNTLSGVTASNNGYYGIRLYYSDNNALSGVTAANNTNHGVLLSFSSGNTFSGVTAANNGYYGAYLHASSNNYFTGPLKVGGNTTDCYVGGGTNPGLVNTTCTTSGDYLSGGTGGYGIGISSDATLYNGVTLAGSFVGKVTSDDTANASDTDGTADYPADPAKFDWTSFENAYRGWGVYNTAAFPDYSHQGRWIYGTGEIWDWSLKQSDTGDAGNPAILGVLSLPTGNDTFTHTWSDETTSTFLRNAAETQGDGIGNDNTLCESNETCLYTPNIGSYQGHGNLVAAGSIGTGGIIENVILKQYETNGY